MFENWWEVQKKVQELSRNQHDDNGFVFGYNMGDEFGNFGTFEIAPRTGERENELNFSKVTFQFNFDDEFEDGIKGPFFYLRVKLKRPLDTQSDNKKNMLQQLVSRFQEKCALGRELGAWKARVFEIDTGGPNKTLSMAEVYDVVCELLHVIDEVIPLEDEAKDSKDGFAEEFNEMAKSLGLVAENKPTG
jgi:hypothetical protein